MNSRYNGASFSNKGMPRGFFTNSKFTDCHFENIGATGSAANCKFTRCTFVDARFESMANCIFTGSSFSGKKGRMERLTNCRFTDCRFEKGIPAPRSMTTCSGWGSGSLAPALRPQSEERYIYDRHNRMITDRMVVDEAGGLLRSLHKVDVSLHRRGMQRMARAVPVPIPIPTETATEPVGANESANEAESCNDDHRAHDGSELSKGGAMVTLTMVTGLIVAALIFSSAFYAVVVFFILKLFG